jgi:DNA-binding MarR family transcriptional regulator
MKDTTTVSYMSSDGAAHWTFLTNHAQVLLCLANDPAIRLRDVAETVGITERATQRIVVDLAQAGFLERERHGRRNRYRINETTEMRHPAQEGYEIGELLDLLRQVRSRRNRARQAAN